MIRLCVKTSLYLNFFHLLAQKPNLEKFSIYSNKFFHNFHLSEYSFTCPRLRASGLARRLKTDCFLIFSHLYLAGHLHILIFFLNVTCTCIFHTKILQCKINDQLHFFYFQLHVDVQTRKIICKKFKSTGSNYK